MKRIIIFTLFILCSAAVANAETYTYTWTDDQGVVTFTDNPSRLPSRYSNRAQRGEDAIVRIPKAQKEIRKQVKKKLQATVPRNRIKSTVARAQPTTSPPGMLQTSNRQLGGDQVDPAPPSMKQPTPYPPGVQPTEAPSGMKQPIPAALGDQPKATPSGMQQPKPEPLGDQPTPTPSGMKQPTPKL